MSLIIVRRRTSCIISRAGCNNVTSTRLRRIVTDCRRTQCTYVRTLRLWWKRGIFLSSDVFEPFLVLLQLEVDIDPWKIEWRTYLQDWKMTCLQDFATCLRKMLMTFTAILENKQASPFSIRYCHSQPWLLPIWKNTQSNFQIKCMCSSLLSPHLLKYV